MQSELIPISVRTLRPDASVGTNLYIWHPDSGQPNLFAEHSQVLSIDTLETLFENEEIRLFIESAERTHYQDYLRNNVTQTLEDDSASIQEKTEFVSEVIRDVLAESFAHNDTTRIVQSANHIADHIRKLVFTVPVTGAKLCRMMHHDYGTFTHSTNVGIYSALLAKNLGLSEEDVTEIAVGSLLHDIGKLDIDERILNKPGKLDEMERRVIEKHPLAGYLRLISETDLTTGQLLMTYQHHERMDGTGYPVAVPGSEIHLFAKICAVADVFEALTSNRPYRPAFSISKAMEILESGKGTAFDSEVLDCWSSTVRG